MPVNQVLKEAVRMRPGMYWDRPQKEGLHHLVWEIADNSIDEALAGFASHIQVLIEPDTPSPLWMMDDVEFLLDIQEKTGRPAGMITSYCLATQRKIRR